MSRPIDRLDAQIAEVDDAFAREVLKARRAALLARLGQLAEARYALAGLRTQNKRLRRPALTAGVLLAEGLLAHYESFSPDARDKFRQAHAAAVVADDAVLRAECAAWLAMSDFNASEPAALAAHAGEALRLAAEDAHATRARAALTLGDAWRHAGDDAQAQAWYQRARGHAAAEGDVSLVSILLHNMAKFRVGRLHLDDAFGRADPAEARRVLMETESTGNYDAGVGNGLLRAEMPLLRAHLLTVLGEFAEAVALIDAHLPRARTEGQATREALFLAEALHGEARLGRRDEALRRLRQVQAVLPLLAEPDDRAVTHARLAGALAALGQDGPASTHRAEAARALAAHATEQRRWLAALAPLAV